MKSKVAAQNQRSPYLEDIFEFYSKLNWFDCDIEYIIGNIINNYD